MPRRKIRRKTHICPNCETILEREENYCHVCGQENHNLNVPMKDLVMEVIGSFTFFETKFIETAKIIFTHPGKLTLDFNSGKRAKYMHPVRMYFWVTFIFFFVMSFEGNKKKPDERKYDWKSQTTTNEIDSPSKTAKNVAEYDTNDNKVIVFFKGMREGMKEPKKESQTIIKNDTARVQVGLFDGFKISKDSIEFLHKLNDDQFDSLLITKNVSTFYSNKKLIKADVNKYYKEIIKAKYGVVDEDSNTNRAIEVLPNLLFLMMPFAALILWFFERHTKWTFYFQHLIFTLNTHSAIFLMWSFVIIISKTVKRLSGSDLGVISYIIPVFIGILGLVYFYISLKKVYLQTWLKTTLKFILLSFSYFFSFLMIFLLAFFSGLIHR